MNTDAYKLYLKGKQLQQLNNYVICIPIPEWTKESSAEASVKSKSCKYVAWK